jgi:hypothetical protein
MSKSPAIKPEQIESAIHVLRGERVLLDNDLAVFYGVPTKTLIQAFKRNRPRFPKDFAFQLTRQELASLRSQTVTSKEAARGGRRYLPYAFTEQGVAMLSSVLRSQRAVNVNIEIMRAFVRLRKVLAVNADLAQRLDELESRVGKHDEQFLHVIQAIRQLMEPPPSPKRRRIGFQMTEDAAATPASPEPKSSRRALTLESEHRRQSTCNLYRAAGCGPHACSVICRRIQLSRLASRASDTAISSWPASVPSRSFSWLSVSSTVSSS